MLGWKNDIGQTKLFGVPHIIALVMVVVAILAAVLFTRKMSDKGTRIMLLIAGFVELFMEIIRQIIGFVYDWGGSYNWQWLPLQVCSTVMFIQIIAGFMKKDTWLRQSFYLYIAAYGFFGGLLTLAVAPMVVFNTQFIWVLVQTTILHSLMIFMAIHLIVAKKIKLEKINKNFFTKALAVFAGFTILALLVNCIIEWTVGTGGYVNMFFINPWTHPVANPIPFFMDMNLPYVAWLVIFFIGYSLLAFAFLWIVRGLQILFGKAAAKKCSGQKQI